MINKFLVFLLLGSTIGLQAEISTVPSTQSTTTSETSSTPAQTQEQAQWAAWMIEAARVAEDFVHTIDQGRYAESWSKGAQIFQRTITQKEWEMALQMARTPLGNTVSRTLKDERPAVDPKGLPRGPYMVVEYNTSFQKAPNSGELITMMRESNGQWKVLTYQVN